MVKDLVAKSKRFYARARIKKTEKDGEYFDIVFGSKNTKDRSQRTHYGIKAVADGNMMTGKVFFIDPREPVLSYREKAYNAKTGEFLFETDTPFKESGALAEAQFHIGTFWNDEKQRLFITHFYITENSEEVKQNG